MWCAGITGTNGKSTVVHLLQHALDAAARPCARIGTLGMDFDGRTERTPNTTPGADRIHDWLDRARHAGAVCCVLEASSHGLDQERLAGMELDAAGWTNLSRDHLDYHSSWAAYAAAKARLFARLPQDAPAFLPAAAPSIEAACQGTAARLHSFGLDAPDAALCGRWTPGADGGLLEIHGSFGKATVSTSLIGRHNAENLLLSFGLLRCAGLSAAEAAAGLAAAQAPPGRLQAVARESPWRLYVDYAHTPDALRHVLASLREAFPERRIGVLCGAGGDRDHGKRPPMGRAAAEGSDWCVLTSDNPRSEDPKAILEAVVAGARPVGRELHAIVDRREAIRFAVSRLRPGDVLLVAGKGHEDYQEIDGRRLPFDDRLELEEAARCWT